MKTKKVYVPNPCVIKAVGDYKKANEKFGGECGIEIIIILSENNYDTGGLICFSTFKKDKVQKTIKQLVLKSYIESKSMSIKGLIKEFSLTDKGKIAALYLRDNQNHC